MQFFNTWGIVVPVNQELLDASSAFMGGTLFKGLTCSAFTAGVMAIGLKIGEIENSYLRVTRMLALMVSGGDAFSDGVNKFNPGAQYRASPLEMVSHRIWQYPMSGHHPM